MLLWALKNWKLVAGIAAVLLIISLFSAVSILSNKLAQSDSDNQNLIKLHSAEVQKVEYYSTKLGQEVATNQATVLSNKAMKDLVQSQEMAWLNNFKDLKRSMKNLEVAQQMTARAYDSLKVRLEETKKYYISPKGDTIKFLKMKLEDEYNRVTAEQVSRDSGVLVVDIKVPLQQAIYWDKKWFLGKKSYNSDVTSPNKKVTITKLQTIITRKKKSKSP